MHTLRGRGSARYITGPGTSRSKRGVAGKKKPAWYVFRDLPR